MLRILYSCLLYLLTPLIILRLWRKGRLLPAYRKRIPERFTWNLSELHAIDIWVHAVSLGEVVAVTPLVDALLKSGYTVLMTTMTPTGSQKICSQFGEKVSHQYIPYDLPCLMKRFYRQVKPRVAVIMETELWPNMIHYAHKFNIPLVLVNARISDKAFKQYQKAAFFFRSLLPHFSAILAQSPLDADRYIALGAVKSRVEYAGNIKFDMPEVTADLQVFQDLKTRWGENRVALIAASTHHDEESQLLRELPVLQQAIPDVVLLIAPRHPERFLEVFQLSQSMGFQTGLRSKPDSLSPENAVVVLDSMGELNHFFRLSDYAFVGGSLVPIGGHNVLQPVDAGIPVFSGSYVHNFKSICAELEQAQALILVKDAASLMQAVIAVHADGERKARMVAQALEILVANRGAVARCLREIERFAGEK